MQSTDNPALAKEHTRCMKWVEQALREHEPVRTLVRALRRAGFPLEVGRDIVCEPCSTTTYGGFDAEHGQIVICQNRVLSKTSLFNVLAHELVHMYDHCQTGVDWDNLEQWACSEVRAATLSGECEPGIGQWIGTGCGFLPQRSLDADLRCARRSAVRSLLSLRDDLPKEKAEAVVDEVLSHCFKDLAPFEIHPARRRHSPDNDR